MDLSSIEQGAAEPPEISIGKVAWCREPRPHRFIDPCLRNDLAVVPLAAREDELADLRHVAWSQAQSASGIGIAPDSNPLCFGNSHRLEQRLARKFIKGAA